MTIQEAIAMLERVKAKHGPDVPVYFDCPNCKQAFTPGLVETKAVVLASEPTGERSPQR